MSKFKCLIYIRVSTKEQAQKEKNSLENQLKHCREAIKQRGWTLLEDKPYQDIQSGGDIEKRESLDELLRKAKKGYFNLLVVYDFDRLSRDAINTLIIAREFLNSKVQLYSVNQTPPLDPPDDINPRNESRLMNLIFSAFKSESEIFSKVRRYWQGMENKVSRGEIAHPASPPYGYYSKVIGSQKLSERGGHKIEWKLFVDEPKAKIVRRIFDDYLKNHSFRKIAHELTREGVESPSKSRGWYYTTIKLLLENPTYAGLVRWQFKRTFIPRSGKQIRQPRAKWIIHKGKHPAIVSEKKFQAVQELIDNKKKLPGRASQGKALLSGIIYCFHCGKKMYAHQKTKTAPAHYCCSTWNQLRKCDMNYINMIEADEAVIKEILSMIKDKDKFVREYQKGLAEKKSENKANEIESNIQDIENRKKRILDAYEAGAITIAEMSKRRDDLDLKIAELEKEKAEIEKMNAINLTKKDIIEKMESIEDFEKYIKKNKEMLRSQLLALLENVTVEKIKTSGEQKIRINFKKI